MLQQDSNERILLRLRRSLIGVLPHLVVGSLSFVGFLAVIFWIARYPDRVAEFGSTGSILLLAVAAIVVVELVIYVLILTYLGNRLIVTNESILQRLQSTLFHHKTSQLRLTDVQDVTFTQHGFLSHLFHYGTIHIETAGEQTNFNFSYAKDPVNATRVIIEAQEAQHDEQRDSHQMPPPPAPVSPPTPIVTG